MSKQPSTFIEIRKLDSSTHLHPFTDHAELSKSGVRIIERAKGNVLYDSDGNEILDAMAGLWCVNVGYGRTELAEAAFAQMKKLPYYNTFFKSTNIPATQLAARLVELAPNMQKVFFGSSGSESNDTLIRTVRYYWQVEGKAKKQIIISRHKSYHGSTIAAASMGGMEAMHKQLGISLGGFHHIAPPYDFELKNEGESMEEFGLRSAGELERAIEKIGSENVAAFIGEPVQGAGGVIIPPKNYWQEIEKICKRHNILLVLDEVITGFGRTGEWFAAKTFNLQPDLIVVAKGITSGYQPLSAVLVGARVAKTISSAGEYFHGYTYSGHPVACAVALANIDILEREGLIERVKNQTANYLREKLTEALETHELVGQVRTFGLLAAIEITKNKKRFDENKKAGEVVRDCCIAQGIMARAVGDTIILSPPLTWEKSTIEKACELLTRGFNQAKKELL